MTGDNRVRGDVYDTPLALPGCPHSGLSHHAFAVASEPYINENNATVLISSTTGARNQVRRARERGWSPD